MNRKTLTLALSVSLGSLITANAAQAACCVAYDYTDAKNNTTNIISTLSDRINAMQLAIIEAMRLGTGQLSGNSKEQIGASANMANVNDDRRVAGSVEMARFNVVKSAASGASACNVMTGARAGSTLGASSTSLSTALSSDMTDWNLGSSDTLPSSQGRDVALAKRVAAHCATYANKDDVRSGACTTLGSMPNGDIDIGKNLYFSQAGSESHSLDAQHLKAAQSWLVNSMQPNPLGGMQPNEAVSAAGKEKAAQREGSAARESIPHYIVGDVIARHSAMTNSDAQNWASSMSSQISGSAVNFSSGISWYDWMETRAKGWFQNPNWMTQTNNSVETAIKDGVLIQSYQAYVAWETYKLIEKQNILLSAMLSIQSEANRTIAPSPTR